MNNLVSRLSLVATLLLLGGCVTYTEVPRDPMPQPAPEPTAPAPVVRPQPEAVVTPTAPAIVLNPAAVSLARQAQGQYQAQDYQGAIATAERGLRIERRAADLYLLLAQSYLQLGQPDRAKMFVQQGLRFAVPGTDAAEGLDRVKRILDGN